MRRTLIVTILMLSFGIVLIGCSGESEPPGRYNAPSTTAGGTGGRGAGGGGTATPETAP